MPTLLVCPGLLGTAAVLLSNPHRIALQEPFYSSASPKKSFYGPENFLLGGAGWLKIIGDYCIYIYPMNVSNTTAKTKGPICNILLHFVLHHLVI